MEDRSEKGRVDVAIRILHVVGRMDRGGTEALLMNLMRTVDRTEFQYDFVEQTQDVCDYDEEIRDLGGVIYRCPHISPGNLGEYRKWWREFFQAHPEYPIVHGHSRGSGPVYLAEARKAGRITIAHCHNNSHGRGLQGMIRYVWQLPLRYAADYNFACSFDSGVSQFGKHGSFQVMKNGIQTERYRWNPQTRERVRREWNLNNTFIVGNVARFVEQKNHEFLIRVFDQIHRRRPEAKLLLVGQGPLEEAVRRQVRELGLSECVIFAGVRADVGDLMQAMDVFVLPSRFEGLGMVNVEAQTAGLPCFASDRVVPPEVALTELMHFIPLEKSPEEWAKTILSQAIPVQARKDQSGAIREAGFDIRTTGEELHDFYRRILKHG